MGERWFVPASYEQFSLSVLRRMAASRGLSRYRRALKAEVVAMLMADDSAALHASPQGGTDA